VQQAVGAHHPTVAATFNNLGLVLQARGELQAALRRYQQALALEEGALGPDHPQVGRTLLNLSEVEERLDATPAGRAHRERSLAILQSRLGERYPRTATVSAGCWRRWMSASRQPGQGTDRSSGPAGGRRRSSRRGP
jgi:hypothetical protein